MPHVQAGLVAALVAQGWRLSVDVLGHLCQTGDELTPAVDIHAPESTFLLNNSNSNNNSCDHTHHLNAHS